MMTLLQFTQLAKKSGEKFFSRNEMKYWKRRIHEYDVYTGLFISSECEGIKDTFRRYSLRRADFKTGKVLSVSEPMQFARPALARGMLKKEKLKLKSLME